MKNIHIIKNTEAVKHSNVLTVKTILKKIANLKKKKK